MNRTMFNNSYNQESKKAEDKPKAISPKIKKDLKRLPAPGKRGHISPIGRALNLLRRVKFKSSEGIVHTKYIGVITKISDIRKYGTSSPLYYRSSKNMNILYGNSQNKNSTLKNSNTQKKE